MHWRFGCLHILAFALAGALTAQGQVVAQDSRQQEANAGDLNSSSRPTGFQFRLLSEAPSESPSPSEASPAAMNLKIPLAALRPCGESAMAGFWPGCRETGRRAWNQSAGSSPAGNSLPAGLQSAINPSIRWKGVLWQSFQFISIEHGLRMAFDPPSRRSMSSAIEKGEFWQAYTRSLKSFHGWSDGNHFFVNYVGHPLQGAVTGFILIHNDPKGIKLQYGRSRNYWISRAKAMGYSAIYSVYWELGFPLSEAAIGNLGPTGRPGLGAVDLVITPTVGTAYLVAEDVLDLYVVRAVERKWCNPTATALTRSILNLDRSFANLLRWKFPWHRDTRGGLRNCGN